MTSSSPRLAAADRLLLRSVLVWARANGWHYKLTWMEPGRDFDGAPSDGGARRHRWVRPIEGEEQENEVEVYVDCDTERVLSVLFRPDDSDHGLWWGGETAYAYGIQGVVDSLVAVRALPAHFSSAFAAGRESVAGEVQWGARSRNSDACVYKVGPSPDEAREWIGDFTHRFDLVRRVLGDWEVVA